MEYYYRTIFGEIIKWIDRREILAIKGPRQSGKTTLLKVLTDWLETENRIPKNRIVYLSFEDRELLDRFTLNPLDLISSYMIEDGKYYFLIDEAQYCNELGQKLKLIYDKHENAKLIITGSSSLELTAQTGKFLVGRLFEFELLPMNFYEFLLAKDKRLAAAFLKESAKVKRLIEIEMPFNYKKKDVLIPELFIQLDEFIRFGGYPEVVKAKTEEEKIAVLRGIVNTYINKDIISYLHITDTIKFRKFVTLLAAYNGAMVNMSEISTQIGSYFKNTEKLFNILEQTYVINALRPYHKNLATEIRKNPKVYFVDTGLRNYLIDSTGSTDNRPDAGYLAENFVLNELKQYAKMNFWRTTAKTEVDFIATKKDTIPIGVKFSHFDKEQIEKSMYGFLGAYKPKNGMVITKNLWGRKAINGTNVQFIPICYI